MFLRSLPITLAVLAAACAFAGQASAGGRICAPTGYAYGGFQSPVRAYGVAGRLTLESAPLVGDGHVAAWVGVGGPGMGPNGSDVWLQVGIAGFPDGHSELYYEFKQPGMDTARYISLARLAPGAARDVAVYERATQPNRWNVVVDGQAVSPTIALPGSHGAWRPIATGESWGGDTNACNRLGYDFTNLTVATHSGGGWQPFTLTAEMRDPGYRLATRKSGFAVFAA
jgi:hypothetical protein